MKRLLVVFVFILTAIFFVNQSMAQFDTPTPGPTIDLNSQGPRYAACDQCGYCPPNPPPGSWASCQKCLYPDINPDPASQESLKIDAETNLPVTPAIGRQFTFLGCLSTGVGSFSQEGGQEALFRFF